MAATQPAAGGPLRLFLQGLRTSRQQKVEPRPQRDGSGAGFPHKHLSVAHGDSGWAIPQATGRRGGYLSRALDLQAIKGELRRLVEEGHDRIKKRLPRAAGAGPVHSNQFESDPNPAAAPANGPWVAGTAP